MALREPGGEAHATVVEMDLGGARVDVGDERSGGQRLGDDGDGVGNGSFQRAPVGWVRAHGGRLIVPFGCQKGELGHTGVWLDGGEPLP